MSLHLLHVTCTFSVYLYDILPIKSNHSVTTKTNNEIHKHDHNSNTVTRMLTQ